jgi:hypothetical protein
MKNTRKKQGGEVSHAQAGAESAETFARNLLAAWNQPGLPDWLNDALVEAVAETADHFDLPNPFAEPDTEAQIAPLARLVERAGPTFSLRELARTRDARLPTYDPEVEARRADYRQMAESLIQLLSLDTEHVCPLLDIAPDDVCTDEPPPHILWKAIQDHLSALFENTLHNYEDDFLRTLYVELRLYLDQQRLSLKKAELEKESRAAVASTQQ